MGWFNCITAFPGTLDNSSRARHWGLDCSSPLLWDCFWRSGVTFFEMKREGHCFPVTTYLESIEISTAFASFNDYWGRN